MSSQEERSETDWYVGIAETGTIHLYDPDDDGRSLVRVHPDYDESDRKSVCGIIKSRDRIDGDPPESPQMYCRPCVHMSITHGLDRELIPESVIDELGRIAWNTVCENPRE